MDNKQQPKKHTVPRKIPTKAVALTAVAIVGLMASFMGGIQYQKSHAKTAANTSGQGQMTMGGRQGFGGRTMVRDRVFGEVTAVSSTSITVQERSFGNSSSATSTTLTITSDTTVTNSGAAASVSDIATGDTVMITKTSEDSTTAKSIVLNPSFGPGASGSSDSQGSSSTLDTTTN
jgi:hypothetical protein